MTSSVNFASLLPPHWKSEIQGWVRDDVPSIDIGGLVVGDKIEEAYLLGKSKGILAGIPFFDAVFEHLGCTVEWHLSEGDLVDPAGGKVRVATVRGPANKLLLGERTALNTLARASGVATAADKACGVAQAQGWHGHIAGTRRTTPGFRIVEKYALLVGGAATHRLDLSNMVMLKDNHVWSAGSITSAVKLAKKAAGFSSKIEVECRSIEEANEAASAGCDIVMLDNMEPSELKLAAALLKSNHPHVLIEASGGITMATMHMYMSPHVDVISRGNLTQGYDVLDFSLKITKGLTQNAAASANVSFPIPGPSKKRKKRSGSSGGKWQGAKGERVAVPGAYKCIKEPFVQYRQSAALEDVDSYLSPVPAGCRVDGCVEVIVNSQPSATSALPNPLPVAQLSAVALPPAPALEALDVNTSSTAQGSTSSGVVAAVATMPEASAGVTPVVPAAPLTPSPAAPAAAPVASSGAATWLRVLVPDPVGGEPLTRYLPTFMHGEALFEPVLEDGRFRAKAKKGESDYVVPEMQQYYVTFTKITRPRIKIEAPDLPRGELNRELGRRWRELSDEAKRKWVPSLLEENNDSGGTAAVDASSSSLLGAAAAAELHLGESDEDDDDEGDDDDGNLPGDLALPASMVETSVVEM